MESFNGRKSPKPLILLVVTGSICKYMDMETFLANNQVFTIEEARTALEMGKNAALWITC